MTTGAVIMMIVTMSIVTAFAGYFFWKIVKTPIKTNGAEQTE